MKWERIDTGVYRSKILGGWIVRCFEYSNSNPSICFVPDDGHYWKINHD